MAEQVPQTIKSRNELISQLLNENGTVAPTTTPTPAPQPTGIGHLIAKLLGFG